MRALPFCSAFALGLFSGRALAQTTWYVDVHAAPPGTGSVATPYASLQSAHDQPSTVDGDLLLVAPGEYVGSFLFSKRITVRASSGPALTTLRPASSAPTLVLAAPFDEHDSLVVAGFTITGQTGANSAAVDSFDGRLADCVVTGNEGIAVRTGYDTDLLDCTIVSNGAGVEASSIDAVWMKNCIVWGNGTNMLLPPISPFGYSVQYCAGGPFPFAQGPGLVLGDPGLWNLAQGDVHLRPGSPCIDAGDPALVDADGSRSDIGWAAFDAGHAYGPAYECAGKLNSHGCVPQLSVSGLASLAGAGSCTIGATLVVPNRVAVLLYAAGNPGAIPFQGGVLCTGLAFKRAGSQVSTGAGACGGALVFDFNVRVRSGIDPALVPGAIVHAQWWYRDRFDPSGHFSGLTNAVAFGIAP